MNDGVIRGILQREVAEIPVAALAMFDPACPDAPLRVNMDAGLFGMQSLSRIPGAGSPEINTQ